MKTKFLNFALSFGLLLFSILIASKVYSQNLIINPGAELPPVGNGWTQVSGNWQQRTEAPPPPYEGNAYFYAGSNSQAELYQDVDVSAYAAAIDSGNAVFTFTGYVRAYPQSPSDESQEIVEYRNQLDNVLSTFTSAIYNSTTDWVKITDTRIAPTGTRLIRIRLIAIRKNGSDNDGYHDGLSLVVNREVLPLRFISFKIENSGNVNTLIWQTAQEINTSFFNIQQSIDGITFTTIAKINAIGNSNSVSTYKYVDNVTKSETRKIYYRLKEIDKDGTSYYSIVLTAINNNNHITITPNPATDIIHISGTNMREVIILDNTGKLILRRTLNNQISLDVTKFSKGIYYISVIDNNGIIKKDKLVIH